MLLCRTGHCAANPAKPGLQNFCPASHAHVCPSAKYCYALQRTGPALFCRISPEAVLLTGFQELLLVWVNNLFPHLIGVGKGLPKKRGGSMALRAEAFFWLDVWLLCI